jgi:hypothetical protein
MPQLARQLATIPDRLVACAQEIDHFFPHGIDLSIPGHPELLAEITRRHGIELAVTNAAERGADRVSGRLSRAGFRFLQSSGPP